MPDKPTGAECLFFWNEHLIDPPTASMLFFYFGYALLYLFRIRDIRYIRTDVLKVFGGELAELILAAGQGADGFPPQPVYPFIPEVTRPWIKYL